VVERFRVRARDFDLQVREVPLDRAELDRLQVDEPGCALHHDDVQAVRRAVDHCGLRTTRVVDGAREGVSEEVPVRTVEQRSEGWFLQRLPRACEVLLEAAIGDPIDKPIEMMVEITQGDGDGAARSGHGGVSRVVPERDVEARRAPHLVADPGRGCNDRRANGRERVPDREFARGRGVGVVHLRDDRAVRKEKDGVVRGTQRNDSPAVQSFAACKVEHRSRAILHVRMMLDVATPAERQFGASVVWRVKREGQQDEANARSTSSDALKRT
jgi:hypothetical protein